MAKDTEIGVLLDAMNDVQETIRAFDLKAEILTGILTLLIGMVVFAWHGHDNGIKYLDILIIISEFLAIGCLGAVLFPANNPLGSVTNGIYAPKGVYYLSGLTLKKESVSDIAKKLANTNWSEELVFELVKVSSIRERKNRWFVRALWASAAGFGLLFVLCFARYI